MAFFGLFLLLMLSQSMTAKEEYYSVTKIDNKAGIYFDSVGKATIEVEKLELIFTVSIKDYNVQARGTYEALGMLSTECESVNNMCTEELRHSIDSLIYRLETARYKFLHLYLGVSRNDDNSANSDETHNHRRRRSDLFPWLLFENDYYPILHPVGAYAKFFFGVMDISDLIWVSNHSMQVENSLKQFADHIKKNTVVLQENFKKMTEMFQGISEIVKNQRDIVNVLAGQTQMQDFVNRLGRLVSEYQLDTDTLITAVAFAQNGQIHPKLISGEKLYNTIKEASGKLDGRVKVPFLESEVNSVQNILAVSDLKIYLTESHDIRIVLTIPLMNDEEYYLYKPIPLPVKQTVNNHTIYAHIEPTMSYIAISRDYYFFTSDEDLEGCKYKEQTYICPNVDVSLKLTKAKHCEVNILNNKKVNPVGCNYVLQNTSETFWVKLRNGNEWAFTAPTKQRVQIYCDVDQYATSVQGSGIFRLNSKCSAFSGGYKLMPDFSAETRTEMVGNLSPDMTLRLNDSFSFFNGNFEKLFKKAQSSLLTLSNITNEMGKTSVKLDELLVKANKMEKWDKFEAMIKDTPLINYIMRIITTLMICLAFLVTVIYTLKLPEVYISPIIKARFQRKKKSTNVALNNDDGFEEIDLKSPSNTK